MSSDISKLRPELLEISDAEFERRENEMSLARIERKQRKAIADATALVDAANSHIDAVVAGITFLGEHNILPERVKDAFSRTDGRIIAATILRHVTAEQLAGVRPARKARDPDAPVKTRRKRNPTTGELE